MLNTESVKITYAINSIYRIDSRLCKLWCKYAHVFYLSMLNALAGLCFCGLYYIHQKRGGVTHSPGKEVGKGIINLLVSKVILKHAWS